MHAAVGPAINRAHPDEIELGSSVEQGSRRCQFAPLTPITVDIKVCYPALTTPGLTLNSWKYLVHDFFFLDEKHGSLGRRQVAFQGCHVPSSPPTQNRRPIVAHTGMFMSRLIRFDFPCLHLWYAADWTGLKGEKLRCLVPIVAAPERSSSPRLSLAWGLRRSISVVFDLPSPGTVLEWGIHSYRRQWSAFHQSDR